MKFILAFITHLQMVLCTKMEQKIANYDQSLCEGIKKERNCLQNF